MKTQPKKAIVVNYESASGDSHEYTLATFDDDQIDTINQLLTELQTYIRNKQNGKNYPASAEIRQSSLTPHNPKTLKEILPE